MFENIAALEYQRVMLYVTSARFTSSTQMLKQHSVERMVEQILLSEPKGLNIVQIQQRIAEASLGFNVSKFDLELALSSRAIKKTEKVGDVAVQEIYRLSGERQRSALETLSEAERRIDRVVSTIFETSSVPASEIREPFMYALAMIFYQFGTKNAHVLWDAIDTNDYPFVPTIAQTVVKKYSNIPLVEFQTGLIHFFETNDPDYNSIKWNLAQNYFISIMLGLHESVATLAGDVFSGGILYIDTNIAIAALEPLHPLHKGVQSLFHSCQSLSINLRICQASLSELRGWIATQKDLLDNQVLEQIPEAIGEQVDWLIWHIYLAKRKRTSTAITHDDLLASFLDPSHDLETKYSIILDDDEWFDNAENLPHIRRLAQTIRATASKQGKEKHQRASLHDAIMVYWIDHYRTHQKQDKVWFLTADQTLPRVVHDAKSSKPLTITLDALLQWLMPLNGKDNQLQEAFAEMIKAKLLPQERFFKASDFRIFAYMQMQCKNLPEKDIIGCINYIKAEAPNLDPNQAADREKLTTYVQRFFSDPSREFHQSIARYERDLGEAIANVEEVEAKYRKLVQDAETKLQTERDARSTAEQKAIDLASQLQAKEQEDIQRQQSYKKWTLVGVGFACLLLVLASFSATFGQGDNLWQRLSSSMDLILPVMTAYGLIATLYLSRFDKLVMSKLSGLHTKDDENDEGR